MNPERHNRERMTTTIRLWHGTTEQFDTFDTSCALGAHFGSRAAAEGRLHDVARGEGEVHEYEFSFENTLEIVDLGTWGFPSVLRELRSKGVLSAAQVDAAYDANNLSDAADWAFLKDALRAARRTAVFQLERGRGERELDHAGGRAGDPTPHGSRS